MTNGTRGSTMVSDRLTIERARPGMRDRHGYLRWTPTSCRRCGYEEADCTCLGGFAAPASEPALAAPSPPVM